MKPSEYIQCNEGANTPKETLKTPQPSKSNVTRSAVLECVNHQNTQTLPSSSLSVNSSTGSSGKYDTSNINILIMTDVRDTQSPNIQTRRTWYRPEGGVVKEACGAVDRDGSRRAHVKELALWRVQKHLVWRVDFGFRERRLAFGRCARTLFLTLPYLISSALPFHDLLLLFAHNAAGEEQRLDVLKWKGRCNHL